MDIRTSYEYHANTIYTRVTITITITITMSSDANYYYNYYDDDENDNQKLYRAIGLFLMNGSDTEIKGLFDEELDINYQVQNGSTLAHNACFKNSIPLLEFAIEYGADLNIMNYEGVTPFHEACAGGVDLLKILVDNEVNIHQLNGLGENGIHIVLNQINSNLETLSYLIQKGLSVNVVDRSGRTPLYIACISNNIEAVKILLEAGADPTCSDERYRGEIKKNSSEEINKLLDEYESIPVVKGVYYQEES